MAIRSSAIAAQSRQPKQFTSWSFSRFTDYQKCPAYARYKHLDKLAEPASEAMARGTAIHKLAEDYLLGKLKALPKELSQFKAEFVAGRMTRLKLVEEQWVFRQDWAPTQWNNWSEAWLRVKMDYAYVEGGVLTIVDHKTGQLRAEKHDDNVMQGELYVAAGMAMNAAGLLPSPVSAVQAELWYLDQGVIWPEAPNPVSVKQYPKLQKLWGQRTKAMLTDKTFKPRPGNACRWCTYSKAKGGPCQY